jgi:hypothetical protein
MGPNSRRLLSGGAVGHGAGVPSQTRKERRRRGTVYFLLEKVYFLFSYFRKRDKDISEGIRISLET